MNPNNNLQFDQDKFVKNKYFYRYKRFCFKIQKLNRKKKTSLKELESHHIIPESFGGNNSKENRVMFTVKEHLYAHYLLRECTKGIWRSKMVFAFHRMIHGNKGFRKWIDSTFYVENKKQMINYQKENFRHSEESKSKMRGKVTVVNENGIFEKINKNDERYISRKLKFMNNGKTIYKNDNGEIFSLNINDKKIVNENLVGISKNKIPVIDFDGKSISISKDDLRWKNRELKNINSNKICVIDKNGNSFQIDKNDSRWKNKELKGINKGMVTVRDKNGKTLQVSCSDPNYISGEFVHATRGFITMKDINGNIIQVNKEDPRIKTGELVGINKGKHYYNNGIKNFMTYPEDAKLRGLMKGSIKK